MNKEMLKEKLPYIVAAVLVLFATLLMSFKMGTYVGFHRGTFGCQWGDNYRQNFAGGREDFFAPPMGMMGDRQARPHGLFGTVIKNDGNSLIMSDNNNGETVVILNEATKVFTRDGEISKEQLTPDSSIVVIGRPNDTGQVIAKIIRVEGFKNNINRDDVLTSSTTATSTNK